MSSQQERLSNADAAWLHMDRPTNLMVINSVLLFDEQLDWDRLAEIVRTRLVGRYPRFRRRVVEHRLPLRGTHWVEDPDFELVAHLHRRGLPGAGDEAALKELVGDLASVPLDHGKPLWDMYFVDGPGAGCAVIVRVHHCVGDGIALARVMLSLTDADPAGEDPAELVSPARAPSALPAPLAAAVGLAAAPVETALGAAGTTISTGRSIAGALAREGRETLARPRHGIELASGLAADGRALAKLLLSPADAASVFKGEAGTARGIAWTRPIPLARVKSIAHAQGATVNDVLLAAVSGALRSHLSERKEEPREMHALVPFNLRPLDEPVPRDLGNHFGLVVLTLPVDRSSRRERLSELKCRMDEIKHSPEGSVSYAVLGAIGSTPAEVESLILDIFTAKATAVTTNVPGPRETVFLAGTPLRAVLVWAPTAGSVGTSVSILSYAGAVTIGLLVHSALVPDPQSIATRVEREVAALARLAPAAS